MAAETPGIHDIVTLRLTGHTIEGATELDGFVMEIISPDVLHIRYQPGEGEFVDVGEVPRWTEGTTAKFSWLPQA